MKTYSWTMSVKDAEGVRRQVELRQQEIAELNEQYKVAGKSEKAAITRERKQLEAALEELQASLEGAPPKPIEESVVVAELLESLGKYEAHYAELQQGFIEKVQRDPGEAIRWEASSLLVAQEMHKMVSRVMACKRKENEGEWTLDDITEVCEEIWREAGKQISYYDPLNYSTCAFTNLVRAAQYKAHAQLLGDTSWHSARYLLTRIGYREEAVAAWRQLQEE